jgi:hypothetical protein
VAILTADLSRLKDRGSAVLDVALATRPEPHTVSGTVVTLMPGARCLIGEALLGSSYTLSRSKRGGRLEFVSATGTSHVLDLLPAKQPRRLGRPMDHLPPRDVAIRLDAEPLVATSFVQGQIESAPYIDREAAYYMQQATLGVVEGVVEDYVESEVVSATRTSPLLELDLLLAKEARLLGRLMARLPPCHVAIDLDPALVATSFVQGQIEYAPLQTAYTDREVAYYMQPATLGVVEGVVEDYVESEAEEEGPSARPPPAPRL